MENRTRGCGLPKFPDYNASCGRAWGGGQNHMKAQRGDSNAEYATEHR
jgi:hypothetical protein